MDDQGGVPLNGDGEGDSPILVVYGKPYVPNKEPLEVSGPIPNLVILSDSSQTAVGYIESVGTLPFLLFVIMRE